LTFPKNFGKILLEKMRKENYQMKKTEHSRKIDSNGRVILPSQLRDELQLKPGDLAEFFVHEENGRTYLCIECPNIEDEIAKAKRYNMQAKSGL
jgi:AbrB family looped-hinge helix DNA binding protein